MNKECECGHDAWIPIDRNYIGTNQLELIYECENCGRKMVERYKRISVYQYDGHLVTG